MKGTVAILFIVLALAACNQKNNSVTEFPAGIDTTDIVNDTMRQLAIENSYEYSRSLSSSPKLVFDIIGYGGPASKGLYAIIRRGADNKADTLAKGVREGIIIDSWITHLNKTNLNELFIVTRAPDSSAAGNLIVYAVKSKDELTPVRFVSFLGDMMNANYHGKDTFYIQGTQVVREFPLYADGDAQCCPTGGGIRIPYTVTDKELKEGKMEMKLSSN